MCYRFQKKCVLGAGEMSLWLRTLAALLRDIGSIPNVDFQPSITPVSQTPMSFFFLQDRFLCVICVALTVLELRDHPASVWIKGLCYCPTQDVFESQPKFRIHSISEVFSHLVNYSIMQELKERTWAV